MTKYAVEILNVCKDYKHITALDNINIKIKMGDIYGLIGENGSGKTTLLRLITGLAHCTNGEIKLFSKSNKKDLDEERKKIGCLIESPALYYDMTAFQNLEIQRVQRGLKDKECIYKLLELLKLNDCGNKKVRNFSFGMKQRLGIAIALLDDPEILILDEPTNGLDPTNMVEFRNLIKKINRELNMTIIISSHALHELNQIATCFGIIHEGKVLEEISAEELMRRCEKYIYIKVDDVEKTISILRSQLKISKIEITEDNFLKIYDFSENIGKISSILYTNGVTVEDVSLRGDDLETYFTKIIKGDTDVIFT